MLRRDRAGAPCVLASSCRIPHLYQTTASLRGRRATVAASAGRPSEEIAEAVGGLRISRGGEVGSELLETEPGLAAAAFELERAGEVPLRLVVASGIVQRAADAVEGVDVVRLLGEDLV